MVSAAAHEKLLDLVPGIFSLVYVVIILLENSVEIFVRVKICEIGKNVLSG